MANIQVNFNLNEEVTTKLQVTIIDCVTNVNLVSQYVLKTTQEFSLTLGKNTINFEVADGEYSLSNFKFRLFIEGVYYETQCTSKEINCGATCIENYIFTGEFRCVQLNGVNTGNKELQKIDLNSFCTGNPEIWVDGGQDLINCPLVTALTPEWDTSSRECIAGQTKITVKVKNNGGNIVEFLLNNVWYNATIENNGFSYIVPSDGQCKEISFRLKGTTTTTWGCFQAFTSDTCFVENTLSTGTIQVKVYQECQTKIINNISYSGVFFKLVPFTPTTNLNGFVITWSRDNTRSLTVPITQLTPNEWVVENNVIKEAAGINVTISNQNDSYSLNLWSTTCNHDTMPIDCQDNNRNITLNKEFYTIGETVNATANNYNPCNGINWYNTNLPYGNGVNYSGVIANFPAILHAQPAYTETCKVCHGWTEVHLRQNNTIAVSGMKNIYVNLYNTEQELYDGILNKFSNVQNKITEVYSTDNFNVGAKIYKNSAKTILYGTGFMGVFQNNKLKKFRLLNGVIVETLSDAVSNTTSVVGTKFLFPFAHYSNGTYIGNAYAVYNNETFSFWINKVNIASDGLTLTDETWNQSQYQWLFNKQLMTVPLVNWKIPLQYKGTVVEIMIVRTNPNNIQDNNCFVYTIKVGK